MKVAFDARELTLSQPPAGIGRYIHGLFSAMPEAVPELQLTAFCHTPRAPFPVPEAFEPIDVSGRYIGKWTQTAWECFLWGRAAARAGADLIHSTAHLVPGGARVPLVLTVHDLTNFLFPSWYGFTNQVNRSWHLRRGIRKARKIIAVSQATRRDLCRLFPESESKIEVIYEGFDPIFQPHPEVTRQQLGLGFEEPFILWAGTTSPRKNLPLLLNAFERLHARLPDVHLVLLGQRGWKDQAIFDYIRDHRLRPVVHPMGYQPWEMLPLFYSACAVFVFPSFYEGFGLPVVEAMACGAPVLVSNSSSLPELAPEEDTRFDPRNATELTEKLLWVLGRQEVRVTLSRRSLQRAAHFDWKKAARQTAELYRRALG